MTPKHFNSSTPRRAIAGNCQACGADHTACKGLWNHVDFWSGYPARVVPQNAKQWFLCDGCAKAVLTAIRKAIKGRS